MDPTRDIVPAQNTTTSPAPAAAPRLTIEEQADTYVPPPPPKPKPAEPQEAPKSYKTLGEIRKQVANKQKKVDTQLDITEELLHQAWGQYIERLQENKDPSAVTNFRLAQLRIQDESNFEVITESVIQQKFIEAERGPLIEHLQRFFKNRQLKYTLLLEEKPEEDTGPKEKPLSSREQYLKMIELYPAIKDLRDRLGLELDY